MVDVFFIYNGYIFFIAYLYFHYIFFYSFAFQFLANFCIILIMLFWYFLSFFYIVNVCYLIATLYCSFFIVLDVLNINHLLSDTLLRKFFFAWTCCMFVEQIWFTSIGNLQVFNRKIRQWHFLSFLLPAGWLNQSQSPHLKIENATYEKRSLIHHSLDHYRS